jgi:hypothetical protein
MPPNTRWSRPAYRAVFDLGSRFSIFPPDNVVLAPAAQLNRSAADTGCTDLKRHDVSTNLINFSDLNGVHEAPANRWTLFGSLVVFARMPLVHRDQILFLDAPSTQAVYDAAHRRNLLCGDDGWGNSPFTGGCFQNVEQHCVQQEADLKKWLFQRGIRFATAALLLPLFAAQDEPAILTTWKIVVKYARQLFGGDNVVVVGEKADWCLHYHHDGMLTFADEPDMAKGGR